MHSGQNAVVNAEGDFYYDPNLIAANHQYRQYHETSIPVGQENRPGNYFQSYYENGNSSNLFEYGRENSRANIPNRPTPNQRANSKRTTKRPKKTKKQLAFFVYVRQWFQYISCTSATGDEAVIPPGQSSAPVELKRGTVKRANTKSSNNKNLNRQNSNKGNKNAVNKAPTEKKRNHRHKHIPSQQREVYGNNTALNNQYELPEDEEPTPTIAAIVSTSTSAPPGGENPSFSLSNLFPTVSEEPNVTAAPTTNNYAALFAPVNQNTNSNNTAISNNVRQNSNNIHHRGNHNTTPPRPAVAAIPTVEIELETELDDTEFTYQHTYPASPEPSYSGHDENFMSSASPESHPYHNNHSINNDSSQTPPLQSSHQRDQDSTYFNNPLRRRPGGPNQGTSRSLSGTSPLERAQSLRSNNNNRTNTNNGSPTNNNSRGVAATNIDHIPSTMSYQRRIEEQMRQQQANRR